ncbi:MAG: hypothetical protein II864_11945 [Prevotella sp.]|nr:hypothetical protein [Prevotella sp.]
MKRLVTIVAILTTLAFAACRDNKQQQANLMLDRANQLFAEQKYDRALIVIDSLREVYPGAIDTRKRALRLQQDIELKRSQEELAVVDSALEAVKHDYEYQRQKVEKDKQQLRATADELTMLTKTRVRRDSLQTRFDVLCAKIRYIHKKQKEL